MIVVQDFQVTVNQPPNAAQLDSMARMHGQSFEDAWSASVLGELLRMDGVVVALANTGGNKGSCVGFIIARLVLDEAEILTIVAAREFRRSGVARSLLEHLIEELRRRKCNNLLLEVASANNAAIQLYNTFGFKIVGQRPGYYQKSGGPSDDALIMRREIS